MAPYHTLGTYSTDSNTSPTRCAQLLGVEPGHLGADAAVLFYYKTEEPAARTVF